MMGRPIVVVEKLIAVVVDNAIDVNVTSVVWFQAIRDSCGQLCRNESFISVDCISVMCYNFRYVIVTHYHESDKK